MKRAGLNPCYRRRDSDDTSRKGSLSSQAALALCTGCQTPPNPGFCRTLIRAESKIPSASSPVGYDLIVIPSFPKQGFFRVSGITARSGPRSAIEERSAFFFSSYYPAGSNRTSNWSYLVFFWRAVHAESGQTERNLRFSKNNRHAFSRIRHVLEGGTPLRRGGLRRRTGMS